MASILKLYTLVIDYKGGTYIAQSNAKSFIDAPTLCLESWNIEGLDTVLSEIDKQLLISEVEGQEFSALQDINNVWCGTAILNEELVLMNLIETNVETA